MRKNTIENVWDKVVKAGPNDCWGWSGVRNTGGYGFLSVSGKGVLAHRAAYTSAIADPGDLLVLHKCDNKICCNPGHLFIGTHMDNMKDKVAKGRSDLSNGLTITDAITIRLLNGEMSQRSIGRLYNINRSTVAGIIKGVSWLQ